MSEEETENDREKKAFWTQADTSQPKTYLMVQPDVKVKWFAQIGWTGSDAPDMSSARPEEQFETLEEALRASKGRADQTDFGFQVVTTEMASGHIGTKFDEETLTKVYTTLQRLHIDRHLAIDIVNGIQNEGVLFREKAPFEPVAPSTEAIPEGGEPTG